MTDMTESEVREDDWARGVFDRARRIDAEPFWRPDASAASRLSARRKAKYRMAGALATAAIVGLSATAFTTLGGDLAEGAHVSPGSTVTQVGGRPAVLPPYLEYIQAYDETPSTDGAVGAGTATVFADILHGIDPSGHHVRATQTQDPIKIVSNPSGKLESMVGHGFWTVDGTVPTSSADRSKPVGSVVVALLGPDGALPAGGASAPCGLGNGVTFNLTPATTPIVWSPCAHHRQVDGSDIMTTHSTGGLSAGQVTIAFRKFANGSGVALAANSFIEYNGSMPSPDLGGPVSPNTVGASLNPVPWSDALFLKILGGADIKAAL